MKTAGDLLKDKRLLLELTLSDVAGRTKVKPEYLLALEESDFDKLPSAPVTKGFLKSYARVLHLNPDTLIAMYRRDYDEVMGEIMPHGLVEPIAKKSRLFSVPFLLTIISVLSFLGFLAIQLASWWSLPKLDLLQPIDGETYGEQITVKGVTGPEVNIRVGEQTVLVNQDGEFSLDLKYPAGTHRLLIQASTRDGKTRLLERTFTVSK
ncbi:helix-turn-helix domain-containing protein [Candidatus Woesebacteria bacterium]|nr:helix-turn-helix domain-containing protein [Candidatus Woesebacteria bacterium]